MSKELKTEKFSCCQKYAKLSALGSVSGKLLQRVGTALHNDSALGCFLFVCHQIQRCLICAGKRSGEENEVDCLRQQVPGDIAVPFHALFYAFCVFGLVSECWQPTLFQI